MPVRGAESSLPQVSDKQVKENKQAVAKTQKAMQNHAKALYAQHAVTAPKATPNKDLKNLGFVGASMVQHARQLYAANKQAAKEPKVQQAGSIKPEPLPKGFTGFTPAQEKQAAKLRAPKSGGALAGTASRIGGAGPHGLEALGSVLGAVQKQGVQRSLQPETNKEIQASVANALVTGTANELYGDFRHPRSHAFNLLLDALAFGSVGIGGLARGSEAIRAARAGEDVGAALRRAPVAENVLPKRLLPDQSGLRKLRADGGEVQLPLQSRNVATAAAQHAFDRLSEAAPGAPGLGARARIARRIPEVQLTRQLRATEKAIPLALAAKRLRGFRGVTPAEAAYTVVARYGHTGDEGVRLLNMEINRRKTKLSNLAGPALKRQQARIDLLEAAKPLVYQPSEKLAEALTLGKQATEATTQMRLARETKPLSTAAAEAAPAHHIRILHGAEYVTPTAAREGIASPVLERQRGEVARLQKLFDRSVQREAKAPRGSMVHEPGIEPTVAARSSISQRLGSALSVQKDKLARMEAAATKRIEPTGLVGAEHVKPGPLGFFTTDKAERSTLGQLFQRRKSINIPRETIHSRTGATFEAAQEQLGPTVTLKDYLREIRLKGQQADAHLAESFSRPYNQEADAAGLADGTLRLLNPKAKTIPRSEIADVPEVELEALTPGQVAERVLAERTEWAKNVFPPSPAAVAPEHRLGLRVLDAKIADSIQGLTLYQGQVAHRILRAVDGINNLERFLLVYANPAYGPVQATGNVAFLGLLQGLEFPSALAKNTRLLRNMPEDLRTWVDMEVGGGAASFLAHEPGRSAGISPVKAASEKLTDLQNRLADQGPRRHAWLYEAGKEGFTTVEDIARLRDDPSLEPVLNRISERAQQAMVKFRRTPTPLRRALSKVIFILPWIEGSTRYAGRLILDRPFTARAAQAIRERIQEQQKKVLGEGTAAVRGFIPFHGAGGINPMAMSPLGTPADIAQIAKGLVTGKDIAQGLNLGSLLQPSLTAGIEAALRYNTYGGYQYPSSVSRADILKENLFGSVQHPVSGIGASIATMLSHPKPLTGPVSKQPAYKPEGGFWQGAERLAIGSARYRRANVPADVAKGHQIQRQSMNTVQRAQDDGKKMLADLTTQARQAGLLGPGQQQPQVVKQAVRLRTLRYANYAKLKAKTEPDKLLADIKELISRKQVPPSYLSVTRRFLAGNPSDRSIRHQRDLLGDQFYGSSVLSQVRSEINAAIERNP